MPNKDKTGPLGKGALTGRQMGNCEQAEPQEFVRGQGFGRMFCPRGRGMGRGFGFRQMQLTKEQERKILEADLAELDAEKVEIQKRLKEIN